ncbi:hypothetical protein N7530_005271 [Penicillium desertorum]|uniref:Uncharacterized protein n=1 Tax=Penicillium desertorum TaxID=1303715 RepID=A0A9W9X075_9EURO|nr:hypothetical protein N7530_005271 [Penicillium desertorum]
MGDWEVDENGVAGGIEKFKDADTPEDWEKYQIPLSYTATIKLVGKLEVPWMNGHDLQTAVQHVRDL